jgi:hypothetical protein
MTVFSDDAVGGGGVVDGKVEEDEDGIIRDERYNVSYQITTIEVSNRYWADLPFFFLFRAEQQHWDTEIQSDSPLQTNL